MPDRPLKPLAALLLSCALATSAPTHAATVVDARPAGLTGANWQFGPHNRWAYTHLREILPTKAIPNDPDRVRPLPGLTTAAPDLDLVIDGTPTTLAAAMQAQYVDGVLVLKNGRVVAERYAGTLTPERSHLIWSVTKTVTGLVAGAVAADGLIDLDRTVGDYVPELAASGWGHDTLRAVLDMRDSSNWSEDYDLPDSTVRRQDCADGLLAGSRCGDQPLIGNYAFLPTVGTDPERSGTFVYKSGTADVMAWVLERATGLRFADLVSERLWQPMGASRAAGITVDVGGFTLASGGMTATLRDLGRMGQLMLDRGRVGDVQVIPAPWLDDLFSDPGTAPWPRGADTDRKPYYRSFVWGTGDGRGTVAAHGVHGQSIYVAPATGVVIVVLSTWPQADGGAPGVGDAESHALQHAIEAAVR